MESLQVPPYPIPSNEQERLKALYALKILDSLPETPFDRIVRIAARLTDAPIALVSLVDEKRQWFKARCGLDAVETAREFSFCTHAMLGERPMVVCDATQDERFRNNPLVKEEPAIRFYAGAPLRTSTGLPMGTLCVIDTQVRGVPAQDVLDRLMDLADLVSEELEFRLMAGKTAKTLRESNNELERRVAVRTELLGQANGALRDEINEHKLTQTIVSAQNRILLRIGEGAAIDEIFRMLLLLGQDEGSAKYLGAILLKTADGRKLRWAAAPRVPDEFMKEFPELQIEMGNSASGEAALSGKRVVRTDLESAKWRGHAILRQTMGAKSVMATPIMDENKEVLGVVSCVCAGERPTDYEQRVQEAIASLAATVLLRDREEAKRLKVASELDEALRRYQFLADFAPQMFWTANPDGWIDYYNNKWHAYTGLTTEQTQERGWGTLVHPDDLSACVREWNASVAKGALFELELRLRRCDGTYRWQLARAHPFRNENAEVVKWFGTCTDIHEQKTQSEKLEATVQRRTEELRRSLMEKETLLKEVHHRVKNNLQVISSLLRMQAEKLDDSASITALEESRQRVISMALIHERLYSTEQMDEIDFGEYTQTLVNDLFRSYEVQSGAVVSRVDASTVGLKIDQAIPCGLILNELVTNALKYAYPNGKGGEVLIELKEFLPGRVRLSVSDNGVGLPQGWNLRKLRSLGLPIVNILASQLGGTLVVQSRSGANFAVEFPKDALSAHAASAS